MFLSRKERVIHTLKIKLVPLYGYPLFLNYISQTLNETLSINFFDFVNQWRIEAAKPKIIANQDTVLNIALEVGFNARPSFYKAFKQETGITPSEFRKMGR